MLRRKLIFNVVVIAVCGAIALTIPVLVKHFKNKSISATSKSQLPDDTNSYRLISYFIGDQNPIRDTFIAWQICLVDSDNNVIADWNEMYQIITSNSHSLDYDRENLHLTTQGFVYRKIVNSVDYEDLYRKGYSSTVSYKNFSCKICLH